MSTDRESGRGNKRARVTRGLLTEHIHFCDLPYSDISYAAGTCIRITVDPKNNTTVG
jgi:hypothetical protein